MTGQAPRELSEKIKLEKTHRWIFYGVVFLIWLSGAAWFCLRKPWTEPNFNLDSTWPPFWLKFHGAAAMVFLVLVGSLFVHIRRGLMLRRNLVSGFSMMTLVLFLTATGWGLYYLGDERLRNGVSVAHWGMGILLPVILVLHIALGRKIFTKRRETHRRVLH